MEPGQSQHEDSDGEARRPRAGEALPSRVTVTGSATLSRASLAAIIAKMRLGLDLLWAIAMVTAAAGCTTGSSPRTSQASLGDAGNRIEITVEDSGFNPARIAVRARQPVTLVFTRKTEKTCLKDVVVYVDETHRLKRALPLGQPVEIQVTFPRGGEMGYACGMSMYGGQIFVN